MASEPREVFGDLATTAFVESSLLFRSLDPDARRDLVQLARLVAFAAGDVVSPEPDDGLYLLRDGAASVVVAGAGGAVEVAILERGALFGEARVLGGGTPAALVARTDGAAVVLPAPIVAAVAARFPKVGKLLEALRAARERDLAAKLAG